MRFNARRDPRLQDEIRSHRDRLIDDYIAAGASREDAERRAFLEFGNVAPIEEACRDVRGRWFDDVSKDVGYALRTLRRYPSFSVVTVLSLALGIGANTAIFSVVNAVMLRTLPVAQPDRLVHISRIAGEGRPGTISYPLFEYFRDNVRSIATAFAHSSSSQSVVVDGEEELVNMDLVSGTYYEVLGLAPAVGRLLGPADDAPTASDRVAVISDRYWQRRFGRAQAAVGKSFTIRDRAFTIVGVVPSSFQSARAGSTADIVVPLQQLLPEMQRRSPDFNSLSMLARLRPGASIEQANAEVQALYPAFVEMQSARAEERERAVLSRQRAAAWPAPDGFNPIRDNLGRPLLMLLGIVGLILLLACANVSALLVARAAARQREISVRLAIGAGRGRLVRQFLIESLVLSVLGSVMALLLAGALGPRLLTLMLNGRVVDLSVDADWRVLLFTIAVSSVVCLTAGLVPAFQAVRGAVNPALREVPVAGHRRLGGALVTAQFAIAMVLVVGATLFVGTLVKLYAVNRGFDSDGLLVVSVRALRQYSPQDALIVQASVLERLEALPGVQSATAARILPVSGALWDRGVRLETDAVGSEKTVGFNAIAPGYFRTLSTPVVAGREFDRRDAASPVDVAIVNESFARRFFPDGQVLGGRVTSVNATYQIVGVVADAKYEGLRAQTMETMYVPWTTRLVEQPTGYSYVLRLTSGDSLRMGAALDAAVREADPALRFRSITPYTTLIDRSIGTERMMATLGGAFGVLALVVAAVGMFGVLAFQVARRSNELGVRSALGATRWAVMCLVLTDVMWMLVPGAAIGAAMAAMLTGLARSILFDLAPHEPGVFAIAASVLVCSAMAAAWLPVRRASRVDPLIALRHE